MLNQPVVFSFLKLMKMQVIERRLVEDSFVTTDSASYVAGSNVVGPVASATNSNTASFVTASKVIGQVASALTAATASFVSGANVIGAVKTASTASFVTASAIVGGLTGNVLFPTDVITMSFANGILLNVS